MKRFIKFLVFPFVFIFAVAGLIPASAVNTKADSLAESVISYNLEETSSVSVQDWIDGYLAENAGNGAEWYVIALSNYGNYDFTSYRKALSDYLASDEVGSASSRLKFALTLIAAGDRDSQFITEFLENSVGEQGIMSLVFGLHILNNGYTCEKYSVSSLTDELLSLQSADGGWSLTGKNGDIDVTAMTVQALSAQYSNNANVKAATDKALSFLSSRQNADGTYSSYGVSNSESVSQVIIALSSLGIDIEKDGRFIKNSKNLFDALEIFCAKDGGYSHQEGQGSDSTATVQAFCAAVAFSKMKNEGSAFYLFSEEKHVITETPDGEKQESENQDAPAYTQTTVCENESGVLQTESIPTQAQTVSQEKEDSEKAGVSYKIWIILAIVAVSVCICSVLLITKKKKKSVYIAVIIFAVAAILLMCFTDVNLVGGGKGSAEPEDAVGTVTLNIRCDTLKDKNDSKIPKNGIILEKTEVQIDADDTVYDVLSRVCMEKGIHFEVTGGNDTLYVEGIGNIYEKDYGELSGWMYFVNEKSPSVGCGNYKLTAGDQIEWLYTCNLGDDLDY